MHIMSGPNSQQLARLHIHKIKLQPLQFHNRWYLPGNIDFYSDLALGIWHVLQCEMGSILISHRLKMIYLQASAVNTKFIWLMVIKAIQIALLALIRSNDLCVFCVFREYISHLMSLTLESWINTAKIWLCAEMCIFTTGVNVCKAKL